MSLNKKQSLTILITSLSLVIMAYIIYALSASSKPIIIQDTTQLPTSLTENVSITDIEILDDNTIFKCKAHIPSNNFYAAMNPYLDAKKIDTISDFNYVLENNSINASFNYILLENYPISISTHIPIQLSNNSSLQLSISDTTIGKITLHEKIIEALLHVAFLDNTKIKTENNSILLELETITDGLTFNNLDFNKNLITLDVTYYHADTNAEKSTDTNTEN